jgi:hypothetical protein
MQQKIEITNKPLLIDAEKGRKSVLGYIQRGDIQCLKVDKFPEAENIIWQIWKSTVKPAGIVFDGVSALASKTIQDVVMDNPTAIWDNRARLQASQPTWQQQANVILRLLRVSRALNIPLVLTAWEQTREDELTKVSTHFPSVNPALLTDITHNADTVLRVYRTAGRRMVRCQPDDNYYAKIRVPDNLPPAPEYIENKSDKDWAPTVDRLKVVSGGLFKPLDDSGELSPMVLYGLSGVGKTRLAVELILSV